MMPSMIPIARASYADTLRKKTNTLTSATKLPASVQAKAASGVISVDAFPELIAPSKMGQSDPNKASVGKFKPIPRKASYASVLKGDIAGDQKLSARVVVSSATPIEVKENEEKPQEMRPFVVVARKPAPATKLPKKKNVCMPVDSLSTRVNLFHVQVIHRAFNFITTNVLPAKVEKVDVFKPINQSKVKQSSNTFPVAALAELQNKSNWQNKGFKKGAAENTHNTSDVINIVAPKNVCHPCIRCICVADISGFRL